jgi:HlyD family secretion protein
VKGIKMNPKVKFLKTILKMLPAVFSFAVLVVLTSCSGLPGPFSNLNNQSSIQSEGMQTYTVVRGNIIQEASTTGSVDVKTTNTYNFKVTGKVISALEQGAAFKKGEVLVELDNSDGKVIISDLEDSLLTAEDNLAFSKSSLITAKMNYQKALDENHIAIQLADLNTQKSQEATASALLSLENANRSADLAYASAISSLENTKNGTSWSVKSAQSALNEAQRILEEAKVAFPATTAEKLAQYEYNVKTAMQKLEQAIEEQQSSVSNAEDSIGSIDIQNSNSLDSAQTSYEQSLIEQSTNYWNNLSSTQSMEVQMKVAQLSISDASLKLNQAQRSVENFKQDIEDAKKELEDYKVLAPYDGIISSIGYKEGEQSSQGAAGISILSTDYILKATISENDLPKVKLGNKVAISLDAYSDVELSGTLEKINPVSTNTNGIVTYEVLIGFQDVKDVKLFYGLSANISIITAEAENVLYVPLQSVYKENGKSYVDVLRTGRAAQTSQADRQTQGTPPAQADLKAKGSLPDRANLPAKGSQTAAASTDTQAQTIDKVEVTTGINDYVNIEIKSGINEGDIIVTSKVTQ